MSSHVIFNNKIELKIDENNLCGGPEIFKINDVDAKLADFICFYREFCRNHICHFSKPQIELGADIDVLATKYSTDASSIYKIAEWLKSEYGKHRTCDGCY